MGLPVVHQHFLRVAQQGFHAKGAFCVRRYFQRILAALFQQAVESESDVLTVGMFVEMTNFAGDYDAAGLPGIRLPGTGADQQGGEQQECDAHDTIGLIDRQR